MYLAKSVEAAREAFQDIIKAYRNGGHYARVRAEKALASLPEPMTEDAIITLKLVESEEEFKSLTIERKMLNNAARDSGNAMIEMLKKRLV